MFRCYRRSLPCKPVTKPERMGELCIRASRYCAILLCVFGLPLILGAYPLLSMWVGRAYAARSALYLQLLVVGNIVRQLASPYVIACGGHRKTTLGQHLGGGRGIGERGL